MFNWIHNWSQKRKIKKDTSDFRIKSWTNQIKSSCINEIIALSDRNIKEGESLFDKITKRIKAKGKHYIIKDLMGNEIQLKHPIFTQAEISQISKTIRKYYFTIILFVVFETLLWLFAADAFFPELPNTAKYLISFILGAGLMLLIERGFGNLSDYQEALIYKEEKGMGNAHFNKYKSKRLLGYFLIGLVIVVIIGLGIARVILLTPTSSGLFSTEEFDRLKLFNIIAPMALSVLSIGIAIYMGSAKLDQSKYKIRYDAYKKWHKHIQKMNSHILNMRKIIAKLNGIISYSMQKGWDLVIDLKRICGLEYDIKFQNEYEEYIKEKRNNNFFVNDEVYRKYENIISVDQMLFNYGITSNGEVQKIFNKTSQYSQIVNEVDSEYNSTDMSKDSKPQPIN